MRKLGFYIVLMLFVNGLYSQSGSQALYDLFPALPTSMTNQELTSIIKPERKIEEKFCTNLTSAYTVGGGQEYFVIGKYEVGKIIHLMYGVVSYIDKTSNDYSMNIACSSFNSKNGEMVTAGLQNYLGMVGNDALKRESNYLISGEVITFVMISTDNSNKVEKETTKYKFGKYLEFISRE